MNKLSEHITILHELGYKPYSIAKEIYIYLQVLGW